MPSSTPSLLRPAARPAFRAHAGHGFTLTELLVAIGIIALLIAILLPALSKVIARAKTTQTQSTIQEFAKACDAFQQEFGFYPGIVPEAILASDPKISGTENALLHLMGGAVDQDDPAYGSFSGDWTQITFGSGANTFSIKVNPQEIGRGPRVAGKQYPPFFAPKQSELIATTQTYSGSGFPFSQSLPDLVDSWGQPVLYLRAMRDVGPLVGAPGVAQFAVGPIQPYIANVIELGELGRSQETSILVTAPDVPQTLAQIIRQPAFGKGNEPLNGTARGRYAIISAGPDGVFFSRFDGIGTQAAPKDDIVSQASNAAGPTAVQEYDDIRVFGGG